MHSNWCSQARRGLRTSGTVAPGHRRRPRPHAAGRGAALDLMPIFSRNVSPMYRPTENSTSLHPTAAGKVPSGGAPPPSYGGRRHCRPPRQGFIHRLGTPSAHTSLPLPTGAPEGPVHREIPRTAGLSTVRAPSWTPSPSASTRPGGDTGNPQPVDNRCAHPGYGRRFRRPPFFPSPPPTSASSCPRRGKAADQQRRRPGRVVSHSPFTPCGQSASTTRRHQWTTLPTVNPQARPQAAHRLSPATRAAAPRPVSATCASEPTEIGHPTSRGQRSRPEQRRRARLWPVPEQPSTQPARHPSPRGQGPCTEWPRSAPRRRTPHPHAPPARAAAATGRRIPSATSCHRLRRPPAACRRPTPPSTTGTGGRVVQPCGDRAGRG